MEGSKAASESTLRIVDVKSREGASSESEVEIRLTPTGKISHAKTRVYTQRYRKEWEQMPDFKDWLTSVPFEATRAFCKFCERNLHAHRLSLLKHMCTLKHQRAAVQFSKSMIDVNKTDEEVESLREVKYITEIEDEEGETSYEDTSYIQDSEDVTMEDDIQEEVVEVETEIEAAPESPVFKKIRLQKESNQDTLAQAIAEADFIDDTDPIQLEMIVETEPDDNDEEDSKSYLIRCSNPPKENFTHKESSNTGKNTDENLNTDSEVNKTKSMNVTVESDDRNKVYFFSSGGKSYTLVKATNPMVLNQAKKIAMLPKVTKNEPKFDKEPNIVNVAENAIFTEPAVQKNPAVLNSPTMLKNSLIVRKPFISTNVLDTSKGNPISGLQVSLYKLQDGRWTFIHESISSSSGNCSDFADPKYNLTTGRFKLHYDTERYYSSKKIVSFYPFIEIVFDIKDPNETYHFPLLVSPFSYSTYKSSSKTN